MARLRRDTVHTSPHAVVPPRPLRLFATGTVFLTHTLLLPACPLPSTTSRAQAVHTARGGTAGHVLALLAQLAASAPSFGDVEPMLVASLGGTPDALRLRDALEAAGVRTKYSKIWPGLGVPSAWVLHARDTGQRTVINHNPLPDVSHEDFIVLLGPVLAPENYVGYHQQQLPLPVGPVREQHSSSPIPLFPNTLAPSAPRPSLSSRPHTAASTTLSAPAAHPVPSHSPHSPAPFDWLHFEGRSIRPTVSNILGVDGLARERKWRAHCVISVDLGRRARDGVEVLLPHADVIFLCATTFSSPSPSSSSSSPTPPPIAPRAILLSLARHAPPHALLVLDAGRDGAALLSLPTREYLQSSGWTPPSSTSDSPARVHAYSDSTATTTHPWDGVESVRTGSDFWAGMRTGETSRDSAYTDPGSDLRAHDTSYRSHRHHPSGESFHPFDEIDEGDEGGQAGAAAAAAHDDAGAEDGRHTPQPRRPDHRVERDETTTDDEGAHAAFVAGMIWSLSRRLLPGSPYTPGTHTNDLKKDGTASAADIGLRWRLDECLRFATELAGRRARVQHWASFKERNEWDGLGEEMRRAGWFD